MPFVAPDVFMFQCRQCSSFSSGAFSSCHRMKESKTGALQNTGCRAYCRLQMIVLCQVKDVQQLFQQPCSEEPMPVIDLHLAEKLTSFNESSDN